MMYIFITFIRCHYIVWPPLIKSLGSASGLAGADGEPGAEVDELGEDELLSPPAPSKWM
jgi:hypothetical protein